MEGNWEYRGMRAHGVIIYAWRQSRSDKKVMGKIGRESY